MTPLVLLHGATGAAVQFQPLIHKLHEFANFSFDFEGHGEALATSREFRIENFAENLQNFIEHHSLAPARIVGYSMGGYVALWLAAHRPELVHSILTLGTNIAWTPEHAARQVRFLNADLMLQKVPQYAQELEERHRGSSWRTVLSKTENMMLDLGENPRLTDEVFAQIQCHVRYCIGDRDVVVSLDETRNSFQATHGAELSVLPGTKHPIDELNLERLAFEIRDFFPQS